METAGHTDKQLEESVRIALRDFGVGILAEERLMGILKDYQGFRYFTAAEYIVRTLIADGTFSHLYSAASNGKKIQDYLLREAARLNRKYGFSRTYLRRILLSFISGFGYPIYDIKIESNEYAEADKSPRPQSQPQPTPKPKANSTSTGNQKRNSKKNAYAGLMFWFGMIIFIMVLPAVIPLITYLSHKHESNPVEQYQNIKDVSADDQTDTIVTAPDDTIDYALIKELIEKYAKPNQKGRWRESTESEDYESEYEAGYEEGRYGGARSPRSYGQSAAYEEGYEEGLAERKARSAKK